MTDLINTWQLNLSLFIVFAVIFFQFYKIAVKNVKREGVATILLQSIAGLSILLLLPLFPLTFPTGIKTYLLLTTACVFYAVNDRLQTTIRKNLQVSVYSILNQLTQVFLIIFGILLFKEPFVLSKIIGAALILGANVYLFYKKGKFEFNKYVLFALFSSLVLAVAMSIDIGISKQFNLPFYIMFTLIVPALIIAVVEKISLKEVRQEFIKSKERKYYIITGLSWGLLIFFMLRAYRFGKVTTVTPLSSTTVFLNVVIAFLFLNEKKDIYKKIVAALLVILGIYLTA